MGQMPNSFKPIDMPDSFSPIVTNEEPGLLSRIGSNVSNFINEHPIAQRLLTGFSTSDKEELAKRGITNVQGPELMKIPGVESVTNKLEHAIDPTDSPFYTGVRPFLAGGVKLLGDTLASGFDPRTAGIKRIDNPVVRRALDTPSIDIPSPSDIRLERPNEVQVPKIDNVESLAVPESKPLIPSTESVQSPALQKLQIAIDDVKPLNKEQQQIYHAGRQERLAKMKDVSTTGQAGYYEQLGKLKGEFDKVKFEPIKLEQADVDELFNTISNHPASIGYNEIKAKTGLAKLLSGQVPQRNEIELLRRVFGDQLTESLTKNLPTIDKAGGLISEAVNLPKSLMASYDLSAPFRQGIGLAHKKEFWTSFDDMFRSLGSENGFRTVQSTIEANPNFALSQDAGLSLTELVGMTNREEQFMSNWAERIPLLGRGVRASNRAYIGFLNKLRSDTFSRLVDDAERASKSLEITAKDSTELQAAKLANPKTNLVLANEFANFVNTATGRGNLGKLEQSAVALNNMFFSPRLIASRVRMLNPQTYISASPAVRKEYIKSLLAIASVGGTVGTLGSVAGGEVSRDLISADAGKVKIGNTRLDPYGGFQQYIVAASRLLSGQQTSSTSGNTYDLGGGYGLPTRLDVVKDFAANKLAPVPKFAYDILNANKHQPFSFSEESAKLFVPLLIQDVISLATDNPDLIPGAIQLSKGEDLSASKLPLAVPASLGMGLQTYR